MSNSRAFRRRIQQQLAAADGRTIPVPSACCALELVVSPTSLAARHDADCPALNPSTPAGWQARQRANQAVTAALQANGYGPTLGVMM